MGVSTKCQLLLACCVSFLAGFFAAKALDYLKPFDTIEQNGIVFKEVATPEAEVVGEVTATAATTTNTTAMNEGFTKTADYFDQIAQTAYQRVTFPPTEALPRNTFDINFWENESGLTTQGGLKRLDRILLAKIYGNASSVFEYGLGESTYMAHYVGVPRYAGIDSDPAWVDMARKKVDNSYRFYFADIGTTKQWGYPTNASLAKNILDYQLAPLMVEQKSFDGKF